LAHRQLPVARALPRRSRGLRDVPDGGRAEPARRRRRAPGIRGAPDVDDVGGGGVGPGGDRPRGDSVPGLPPRAAERPRHRPGARDPAVARTLAAERLAEIGPMSWRERGMLIVFCLVLALWIGGDWLAVSPTTAALAGVALLLLVGVLDWRDIVEERSGWDVFVWFGGLMMRAAQLEKAGFPQERARPHGVTGLR